MRTRSMGSLRHIAVAKNTLRYKKTLRGTSGGVTGQRRAGAHPAAEPSRGHGPARSPLPAGHRQRWLTLTGRTCRLEHPALVKACPLVLLLTAPKRLGNAVSLRSYLGFPASPLQGASPVLNSSGATALVPLGSAHPLHGWVKPPFPSRLPPPPFPKAMAAAGRRLRLGPSVPTRPTHLRGGLASLPPHHVFPGGSSRNSHFFLKLRVISWNTCNSPCP